MLEVPLCLFSSDGFGVSWRPPSCALQLRMWCPSRFSRQKRPVELMSTGTFQPGAPLDNKIQQHLEKSQMTCRKSSKTCRSDSIMSHGLLFGVFLMSVSGPVMHYGCTLVVVSAMVGGVVAYVAWPGYVCSRFTSLWCQSEFVLIGKVQEHLTRLQMNAPGDLIHSLRRQQCHLQQLLAFPIRRTTIDGHSFSQSFRMHQGSTMNQNPCLSCLARFGHMQIVIVRAALPGANQRTA